MNYTIPTLPKKVTRFAELIHNAGGTAYIAGGFVRDMLLNIPCKDIDLEVHGLDSEQIEAILSGFAPNKSVGKSFGVWKLLPLDTHDIEIDITIPIHKGQPAPHLGVIESCRRRDLTINSILYNIQHQNLVDPFKGLEDLLSKTLRATDPNCFAEDLLRVFRVGQFSGRFNCTVDPTLLSLCQILVCEPEFVKLPSERVLVELQKGWLKSPTPTTAIKVWFETGALPSYLPDVSTVISGANKALLWSKLNRAASFRNDDKGMSMGLFWSVLLHDMNIDSIERIFDRLGIHRYLGFPVRQSVQIGHSFVESLSNTVSTVVQNMATEAFDIEFLCMVAHSIHPEGAALNNLAQAKQRGLDKAPLPRLLTGTDILNRGIQGPQVGLLLHQIRVLQLQEIIHTRSDALKKLTELLEYTS